MKEAWLRVTGRKAASLPGLAYLRVSRLSGITRGTFAAKRPPGVAYFVSRSHGVASGPEWTVEPPRRQLIPLSNI